MKPLIRNITVTYIHSLPNRPKIGSLSRSPTLMSQTTGHFCYDKRLPCKFSFSGLFWRQKW